MLPQLALDQHGVDWLASVVAGVELIHQGDQARLEALIIATDSRELSDAAHALAAVLAERAIHGKILR